MARLGRASRGASLMLAGCLLALATAPGAARAGSVPYFHDFLGKTCIMEADLETAYREGFKGTRPPPLCIEQPCADLLDRETYDREILGRPASEDEWQSYLGTRATVCSSEDPDALARLLPVDPPADPVAVTRLASAADFDLLAPVAPWQDDSWHYGSHQVDRPDGQRGRSDPFDLFTPGGLFGGGTGSGSNSGSKTGGSTGGGGTSTVPQTQVAGDSENSDPAVVPALPAGAALASALAMAALLRRRAARAD
ncbi:hypothetical protein [Mangrovicoccus sp. HB161399]|uniref:hypothetical protein n=1 Tax=Mangrovicoccus sp. HB161399 TaxID=2720392 RepID=UPI001554674B|nr:hypothetical protein [Mangrovicoccus sp. HB161399]